MTEDKSSRKETRASMNKRFDEEDIAFMDGAIRASHNIEELRALIVSEKNPVMHMKDSSMNDLARLRRFCKEVSAF